MQMFKHTEMLKFFPKWLYQLTFCPAAYEFSFIYIPSSTFYSQVNRYLPVYVYAHFLTQLSFSY